MATGNMNNHGNLTCETFELKFGETFTNPNGGSAFHTLKYDFKPANVDENKAVSLEVGTGNQIAVTVPHIVGSAEPNTVFEGSQTEYSKKDCVLIINRLTGVVTIERLSCHMQVKKTRTKTEIAVPKSKLPLQNDVVNPTMRKYTRSKIVSGSRKKNLISLPKHSPLQKAASYPSKSPLSTSTWNPNKGRSTMPCVPMIGVDDGRDVMPTLPSLPSLVPNQPVKQSSMRHGDDSSSKSDGCSNSKSDRMTNKHDKINSPVRRKKPCQADSKRLTCSYLSESDSDSDGDDSDIKIDGCSNYKSDSMPVVKINHPVERITHQADSKRFSCSYLSESDSDSDSYDSSSESDGDSNSKSDIMSEVKSKSPIRTIPYTADSTRFHCSYMSESDSD